MYELPTHISIWGCQGCDGGAALTAWVTTALSILGPGTFNTSTSTGQGQTSLGRRKRSKSNSTAPSTQEPAGIWPWKSIQRSSTTRMLRIANRARRQGRGSTAAPQPLLNALFNLSILFIALLNWQLPQWGTLSPSLTRCCFPRCQTGGQPARRQPNGPLSTTLIISSFP